MNEQILKRFERFAKIDNIQLSINSISFDSIPLSNESIFNFVKGKNKYIRESIARNPGNLPVVGASLDNQCISSYVTPLSEKDVVRKPCVSFNKDNAKGSRAFFRNYPFVMDRHHIAILADSEKIDPEYFYYFLDSFLISQEYGWGENVATVEAIRVAEIPVPNYGQDDSLSIQKVLVQFIRYEQERFGKKLNILADLHGKFVQLERLIVPRTLSKEPDAMNRLDQFIKRKHLNLPINEIEFLLKPTTEIGEFKGGSSKLTADYMKKNLGDFPVYSASTDSETKGMSGIINEFEYDEECIHITKNGENTGTVFYMEKHKHSINGDRAIFRVSNGYSIRYLYHLLLALNLRSKHNWENKLSKKNFESFLLKIPDDFRSWKSKDIQIHLASFFDSYIKQIESKKKGIKHLESLIPQYQKKLVSVLFNSLKAQAHAG